MTQSFEQKVDWVNRLDEVIKSAASNLAPVEESHQECLSVVAVTAASVEVLSACVLDEVVVMGTTQGLSTRELGQEAGPVKQLVGLDSPVHQMVHLPSLQVRYSISSLDWSRKICRPMRERACYNVYRVGELTRGCLRCWCWPPEETERRAASWSPSAPDRSRLVLFNLNSYTRLDWDWDLGLG